MLKSQRVKAFLSSFIRKAGTFGVKTGAFICWIYTDLLIVGGLAVIDYATFQINRIAGLYVLGAILLISGIWFTAVPPERR